MTDPEPAGPVDEADLLQARAVALARRPASDDDGDERLNVTLFRLGSETYAVDCRAIREVLRLTGVVALPGAPAFVLGVVNVRGRILSVVDLRVQLGVPVGALTPAARVVVLSQPGMEFGLVAEEVFATAVLPVGDIGGAPAGLAPSAGRWLRGVTGERVIVLEADSILRDAALLVSEAGGPAPREVGGRR